MSNSIEYHVNKTILQYNFISMANSNDTELDDILELVGLS